MRVVGVIAEYNPLHNGHIYHLEQAKRKTGASYCIVVMSGNFVQRGEPACTDKFTRAEWALQAGADLVIELPTVFANASAERFAEGAVRLLHATG
ncbi:MAG: nucleotidyltransferase family protein, partial [Clostridia bacterium]|nr:nucleotidyltransferase family protein [Clostridia bacterium]